MSTLENCLISTYLLWFSTRVQKKKNCEGTPSACLSFLDGTTWIVELAFFQGLLNRCNDNVIICCVNYVEQFCNLFYFYRVPLPTRTTDLAINGKSWWSQWNLTMDSRKKFVHGAQCCSIFLYFLEICERRKSILRSILIDTLILCVILFFFFAPFSGGHVKS